MLEDFRPRIINVTRKLSNGHFENIKYVYNFK